MTEFLPGEPAIDAPCPTCGGSGRVATMTRAQRQAINDAMLRARRPGDPLPARQGAAPQGVALAHPRDSDSALRARADLVLNEIDTSGTAQPRTRSMTWSEIEGGGSGGGVV